MIILLIALLLPGTVIAQSSWDIPIASVRASINTGAENPAFYIADNDDSTAWACTPESTAGFAEITLAKTSLIYGIGISCDVPEQASLSVYFRQDNSWKPFTGARYTGLQADDMFIDLSFDRAVTDTLLIKLSSPAPGLGTITGIDIKGRDADAVLYKLPVISVTSTENTSCFTPEENLTDNNVYTEWQTIRWYGDMKQDRENGREDAEKYLKERHRKRHHTMKSPYESEVYFDFGG